MAFDPLILTTSLAVAGVVAAVFLVLSVRKYPKGNEKMIAKAGREPSFKKKMLDWTRQCPPISGRFEQGRI